MPPRPKFTKEEIIDASYELVKESGIESFSARILEKKLNCGAAPIFTQFESMEALKLALFNRAKTVFTHYMQGCEDYFPMFKEFGIRWVRFGVENPNIYSLLFGIGSKYSVSPEESINEFSSISVPIIAAIEKSFNIKKEDAINMFVQMIIYGNGITSFIVQGNHQYDEPMILRMLSYGCIGNAMLIHERDNVDGNPQYKKMIEIADHNTVKIK